MKCLSVQQSARLLAVCLATMFSFPAVGTEESTDSPPPAPRRTSVVLILADVGMDDLGCYGASDSRTPTIDKMASEGARFTSFYAGSPLELPARATLMLGMDTGHLKIRDNSSVATLRASDLTFGQLLLQSGYRTGFIGVWDLSDGASGLPQNKGFEQFAGFFDDTEAADDYAEFIHRYDPNPTGNSAYSGRVQIAGNEEGKHGQYIPDLFTTAALNFIRISKPAEYNKYRPFFLMLAYPNSATENKPADVSRLDGYISQILTYLKTTRLDNTIVMLMGTPNRKDDARKDFVSEENLRVPFIVYYPERLKPTVVSEPWAAWDVFPTLADNARAEYPTNMDGVSFYPMLRGYAQTNHHDFLYWETHDAQRGSQQAARMGNWKAVRQTIGGSLELYDLKSDPAEKKNVADKNPDVIQKFEERLKSARNDDNLWPLKKPPEDAPPKGDKS